MILSQLDPKYLNSIELQKGLQQAFKSRFPNADFI